MDINKIPTRVGGGVRLGQNTNTRKDAVIENYLLDFVLNHLI